ncbi:MAG: PHP domain-containing protein [Chloroflexota bacterium]|nr:PHP domain-containing protein [Chloroflexota bacterium]
MDAHRILGDRPPTDLTIIPAIEMSANVGDAEVHVLGYFIDVHSAWLASRLDDLQQQRLSRIERFCTRLTSLGLPLTMAEVLDQATGASVGRPHIARAMVDRGYVNTVGEAFDRYLAGGRPAFVPREDVTPESSIELIHGAGGAAVLAHPYTTGNPERTIERLLPLGLDGLEVEYGYYDELQRSFLRDLAARFNLIPTGGSDYHGHGHREESTLGVGSVSEDIVARLQDRAERYG